MITANDIIKTEIEETKIRLLDKIVQLKNSLKYGNSTSTEAEEKKHMIRETERAYNYFREARNNLK